MAELSCGGTFMGQTRFCASTRPKAWASGSVSTPEIGRKGARIVSRACATLRWRSLAISGEGPRVDMVEGADVQEEGSRAALWCGPAPGNPPYAQQNISSSQARLQRIRPPFLSRRTLLAP